MISGLNHFELQPGGIPSEGREAIGLIATAGDTEEHLKIILKDGNGRINRCSRNQWRGGADWPDVVCTADGSATTRNPRFTYL